MLLHESCIGGMSDDVNLPINDYNLAVQDADSASWLHSHHFSSRHHVREYQYAERGYEVLPGIWRSADRNIATYIF